MSTTPAGEAGSSRDGSGTLRSRMCSALGTDATLLFNHERHSLWRQVAAAGKALHQAG